MSTIRTARIGSLKADTTEEDGRCELDSHADTCVIGNQTARVIADHNTLVDVHGYDGHRRNEGCRTVSTVVAYDHPETGKVFMLILHQAILIPHMKTNLLSPMQLRDHGLRVNDEPKYMVADPTEDHHAIVGPTLEASDEVFRIPLRLDGVISYFSTRKPSKDEWETTPDSNRIELTSESPPWDPLSEHFKEQEDAMLDSEARIRDPIQQWGTVRTVSALMTLPQQEIPFHHLGEALRNAVRIHPEVNVKAMTRKRKRSTSVKTFATTARRGPIGAKLLAKNWNVGVSIAQRTIDATTQRGIRTILHPTLSRRFRTNDRQLRYRRLSHDVFTDTLEATMKSWYRQNKYAQIFATRFGWMRVFPMKKKSEAHEGLSLMAQRDGVPPTIIMDGSKEQTMGEFRRKAKEMGCRVKTTERYSPWQNAAEGAIREAKRGSGQKAVKAGSPSALWDHCLELKCLIRSHTASTNYAPWTSPGNDSFGPKGRYFTVC